MMSDSEIEQIDEWRFRNKIATRSDAVRRMVEIALWLDSGLDTLLDRANDLHDSFVEMLKSHTESLAEAKSMNLDERAIDAIDDASVNIGELFNEFQYLEMHLSFLNTLVQKVTKAPTRDAAVAAAEAVRDEAERSFDAYLERIVEKRRQLTREYAGGPTDESERDEK